VARELRALGVKGTTLIRAAELGYITELRCGMPKCFCPEELGGAGWFAPRTKPWNDWEPTHEHFPISRRDGGKATPDNTVLAHRICNKLDYSIFDGQPIEKLLARIEAARVAAAAANLPQSAPAAEAVAEVIAPEPASLAKSPQKRDAPAAWKSLPPAELAAHLLATLTITDTAWTTEKRLPDENRESFIRRIVLCETEASRAIPARPDVTARHGRIGGMAETAVEKLEALGVRRGILWQLARDGQIIDVSCEMPQCYCFRGRSYFEPRPEAYDWEPTANHYPRRKMDGGHLTSENVRLAHRLCNRRDYQWRVKINAMLGKRMSLEAIAEQLNAEKVPTVHGTNRWTAASVRKAFVS
jgi:hypothetical protein